MKNFLAPLTGDFGIQALLLLLVVVWVVVVAALLGVPIRRAWPAWFKVWQDCTTDYQTQHYIAKDVYRFWFSAATVFYFIVLSPAFAWFGKDLDDGPGLILAGAAGLFQGGKIWEGYLNRKTKTDAGADLTIPEAQAEKVGATAPLPLQNQGNVAQE